MPMYVYIWEYFVNSEFITDFKLFYNSTGVWVQFFKSSPNYIRTELIVDAKNELRFLTIDYWHSKSEFDIFFAENENKYKEIDLKCNSFTSNEIKIGEFYIQQ